MLTTILLIITVVLLLVLIWISVSNKRADGETGSQQELLAIQDQLRRVDPLIRDEFARNRKEGQDTARSNREELQGELRAFGNTINEALHRFEEKFGANVKSLNEQQREQFRDQAGRQLELKKETEDKLKEIRETVENRLGRLQEENTRKLEEMRKVVDEKLQETVERRFSESFKLISERLELVHKGLGEMQSLASGVGDLKKVLTNVKTRGNLGEIQLGAILEQVLSPEQYIQNAVIRENSQERVEYAIRLPAKVNDNQFLLLPIDSKFPNEDYQRLLEAYDQLPGSKEVDVAARQFENAVRKNARDIREKYIYPPVTTDFAIMFVPTEGLYAEILRRPGLFEQLQRDHKITVVGPTNLVAFLSSLQMGFRTLAIEKRSSEVWEVLGAVKTEFGNFGTILEKTRKKLEEATNVIDKAGVRTRAIERKLKQVEALPKEQSVSLLGDALDLAAVDPETEPEE
ncbi:MAG: DNA recombination protein RmuC [Candidatus Pseudobacter hemicellulosilyticus]|uniref:DNA recombination protein RmuC n=1 Tax=Candidatus Pseudobacter hemicellulosilyticus TaxID=3121375 RepID=A0AAJ6BIW2_9BACT|nr:MAG: DNA recombination protein RmuC [Pseudobacter sp.]